MATGLAIASLMAAAGSAVYSGAAQQRVAEQRAQAAEYSAQSEALSARYEAAQLQQEKVKAKQSQIAAAASSGVSVGSTTVGSLLDTTEEEYQDEIDTTLLRGQMALASGDYASSAYTSQGQAAMAGGLIGAGSSVLSGVYSIGRAQGWSGFKED